MLPTTPALLSYARPLLDAQYEQAVAVFCRGSQILSACNVSRNSALSTVEIHARSIFETGWMIDASGFVLTHSHPSGSVHPSIEDLRATEFLSDIAECMDLPLLDHLIITGHDFFSFRSAGLL